jgi:HTH-type transcriptional regulator / antitoxin HipB
MTLFFSRIFGRSISPAHDLGGLPPAIPDPVRSAAADASLMCAETLGQPSRPRFIRSDIDRAALADLKALLDQECRTITALTLPETLFDGPATAAPLTSMRALAGMAVAARKERGLTPQVVARSAKVTKQFVLDLEQGKGSLDMGKVMRVLAVLGVELAVM